MTDTLTVVIIASVVAACTSTLSGALQHYFQYLKSLLWVGLARTLNIHEVQFHQSKVNQFAGAIFDTLDQDSHCRSFTYKASSWGDGSQHDYIFLPTPTWKAFFLQLCMLGFYVYVPSDPKKSLCMIPTRDAVEALIVASNMLDRNESLTTNVKQQLRQAFHTERPSTNVRSLLRDVSGWIRCKLRIALAVIRREHWIASEDSSFPPIEPLLIEQQSDVPDVLVESLPESQQSMNVDDIYTLFLLQGKYLDKILKVRQNITWRPLAFEKEAPKLYVVDGADPAYSFTEIANQFVKPHVADIIGLYFYDPQKSFHFSQLHEVRESNKELYLILYLPFLEVLEECLPKESTGFEFLAQKLLAGMLCNWTNFLNEISNSCFTYVALVMPALEITAMTYKQSRLLQYAKAVLNNRVSCLCLSERLATVNEDE